MVESISPAPALEVRIDITLISSSLLSDAHFVCSGLVGKIHTLLNQEVFG